MTRQNEKHRQRVEPKPRKTTPQQERDLIESSCAGCDIKKDKGSVPGQERNPYKVQYPARVDAM